MSKEIEKECAWCTRTFLDKVNPESKLCEMCWKLEVIGDKLNEAEKLLFEVGQAWRRSGP